MSGPKQPFNEWWDQLTPSQRVGIAVLAGIEIAATTMAITDLVKRPAALVRGPKFAWGLACAVQPVGPIAYLALGRRTADPTV